jgi:hypothetical protein
MVIQNCTIDLQTAVGISNCIRTSKSPLSLRFNAVKLRVKELSNSGSIFSEITERNTSLSTIRWKVDQRKLVDPAGMFRSYSSETIVDLNLSYSYISDIDDLCELIRSNRALLNLRLSGIKIQDPDGFIKLFSAFEQNSSIDTLRITSLELKPKDLKTRELFDEHSLSYEPGLWTYDLTDKVWVCIAHRIDVFHYIQECKLKENIVHRAQECPSFRACQKLS